MSEKTAALRGRFARTAPSGVWFKSDDAEREMMLRTGDVTRELSLACLLNDAATAEVLVDEEGAPKLDYFGAGQLVRFDTRISVPLAVRIHEQVGRQTSASDVSEAIAQWASRHDYMVCRTFAQTDLHHAVAVTVWLDNSVTVVRHRRNPSTGDFEETSMGQPLASIEGLTGDASGLNGLHLLVAGRNLFDASSEVGRRARTLNRGSDEDAVIGMSKIGEVLGASLNDQLSKRYADLDGVRRSEGRAA